MSGIKDNAGNLTVCKILTVLVAVFSQRFPDDAVNPVGAESRDTFKFLVGIKTALTQQDSVTGILGNFSNTMSGHVHGLGRAEQHAQLQGPRIPFHNGSVGLVMAFFCYTQYPFPCGSADTAVLTVHDFGDCGDGNACQFCELVYVHRIPFCCYK